MQIRTRLTLQFIIISASLIIISMFLIYSISKEQLKNEFYKGLEAKVLMTAEMVVKYHSLEPEEYKKLSDDKPEIILPTKEKISIYNSKKEKVYAFQRKDELPITVLNEISVLDNMESMKFNHMDYSGIGIKYKNSLGEDYLLISQGVFASDELIRLTFIMIIVFLIIIVLIGVSGYFFSVQALSPIASIINQMDQVFPAKIGERLHPSENNDEISKLAIMFNNLLDKTEEAFLNQKGFLSNISHEIKNPLASAITQLEVTLLTQRSNDEYSNVLNSLLSDMKELKNVVEQLMALARITSGNESVAFVELRIDELIWEVQSNFYKLHENYHIKFDTTSLPENPDLLKINGNELLLKTAIANLCENACKYSPDNTAYISLSIIGENNLVLQIEDKGIPIATEEQTLIFKSFYRSPNNSHIKGTGIGLPLVKHILNIHHASIELKAINNTGNKFIISFKQKPIS